MKGGEDKGGAREGEMKILGGYRCFLGEFFFYKRIISYFCG